MSATNGPAPATASSASIPACKSPATPSSKPPPAGPLVCEAGVIRTAEGRATTDMALRVRVLYDGIVEVLEQFRPASMVVEQLFAHYDHPRTAILMAHARGVIFLAAAQRGVPVVSYNASAHQEDHHRQRPGVEGAGAVHHPARAGPGRSCPSRPTWPTPWRVALCHYYTCAERCRADGGGDPHDYPSPAC